MVATVSLPTNLKTFSSIFFSRVGNTVLYPILTHLPALSLYHSFVSLGHGPKCQLEKLNAGRGLKIG